MKQFCTALSIAVISLCLCTSSAFARKYTAKDCFTICYDDDVYTLDDTTFSDENTSQNAHWFFIMYNDEIMIDASAKRQADYAGLTLTTADEADIAAYVDDMLDAYSDENAVLLTTVEAGSQSIPFYIFSNTNEDGPYLMAETIMNGCAIQFMGYYNDSDLPADDRLIQSLVALLTTFEPV